MWRNALLGLTLLLGGCQFAGDPFVGFGRFINDTHTFKSNPNTPAEDGETISRVRGEDGKVEPLLPEPGDIWPGPIKPLPAVQDMQQLDRMQQLPPPNVPSAPPPPLFDQQEPTGPRSGVLNTPGGPVNTYQGGNGVQTFTGPGGRSGIVVPNGNGTSTLIGPNGEIQTVPSPK